MGNGAICRRDRGRVGWAMLLGLGAAACGGTVRDAGERPSEAGGVGVSSDEPAEGTGGEPADGARGSGGAAAVPDASGGDATGGLGIPSGGAATGGAPVGTGGAATGGVPVATGGVAGSVVGDGVVITRGPNEACDGDELSNLATADWASLEIGNAPSDCAFEMELDAPNPSLVNVAVDCELVPSLNEDELNWTVDASGSTFWLRFRGEYCERLGNGEVRFVEVLAQGSGLS